MVPHDGNKLSEETGSEGGGLSSIILSSSCRCLEKNVSPGSLVVLGCPFDFGELEIDDTFHAPQYLSACFRNYLQSSNFGMIQNMEFELNLSVLNIVDIGDVSPIESMSSLPNGSVIMDELSKIIKQLFELKAVTFLVGGCTNLLVAGCSVGAQRRAVDSPLVHVIIGSSIGSTSLELLKSTTFPSSKRIILFGAQVSFFLFVLLSYIWLAMCVGE
jgi:hypothetical protein